MTDEMESKISRRKFLKDATMVTVSGLAAGVMVGCTSPSALATSAPEADPTATPCPTPEPLTVLPEKWDKETDIVIVGFGGAGAAAALEATKAGAKVTILERMKAGGGSTAICGGIVYMGGGTPLQKATGFDDTRDDMFNYLMAATGEGADPELVGVLCDKSLELYDWLEQLGVGFKQSFLPGKFAAVPTEDGLAYSGNESHPEFTAVAKDVPRGHHAPGAGNSGYIIFEKLKAAVDASGAEVLYETLAKKLIVDLDGSVVGVVVDVAGVEQVIKASKAVILTAGSYGYNEEMIRQHNPAWLAATSITGTPGDDGSGIRMGQAVGADVSHIGAITGFGNPYMYDPNFINGIFVNKYGRRFVNEDAYGSRVGVRVVERFPVSYIVVDSGVWEKVNEKMRGYLEKLTVSAGSVAELAATIGVPAVTLESTLRDYNAMVAAGEDIEHQKGKDYLVPLTKAPFYAISWGSVMVPRMVMGGLKANTSSQVVDTHDNPIPHLYAAGANTSGIISRYYPGSGVAVAQALTFGRIAGVNAAAEKPWDAA